LSLLMMMPFHLAVEMPSEGVPLHIQR